MLLSVTHHSHLTYIVPDVGVALAIKVSPLNLNRSPADGVAHFTSVNIKMSQSSDATADNELQQTRVSVHLVLQVLPNTPSQEYIPNSVKYKMVAATSIRVNPMSRVYRGSFGEVREGHLDGRAERMAVKELRPKGDDRSRLSVQAVGQTNPLGACTDFVRLGIRPRARGVGEPQPPQSFAHRCVPHRFRSRCPLSCLPLCRRGKHVNVFGRHESGRQHPAPAGLCTIFHLRIIFHYPF